MAIHFQMGGSPGYLDFPFKNYGSSDIAAGVVVAVDATNVVSDTNEGIGIILPASAGDPVVGVTQEIVKAGGTGRVRCGGIAQVTAGTGGTTAGAFVEADTDGTAIAYVTNHGALGLALTTSAATESALVLVNPSPAQA